MLASLRSCQPQLCVHDQGDWAECFSWCCVCCTCWNVDLHVSSKKINNACNENHGRVLPRATLRGRRCKQMGCLQKWPLAQFIPFGTNEVMTARHKSMCVGKNVLFVDVAPGLADVAWLHTNCTLTIYDHHYSTLQRLKCSGYLSQINTVLCQHMCGAHIWTQCFHGSLFHGC